MIRKGNISSVNTEISKARVYFSGINLVSSELSYIIDVFPNDEVLVAFLDGYTNEGYIFSNLSRETGGTVITEIDGGSFV